MRLREKGYTPVISFPSVYEFARTFTSPDPTAMARGRQLSRTAKQYLDLGIPCFHVPEISGSNIRKEWTKSCAALGLGRIIAVEGRPYDPRYEGLTLHDFRRSAIRNLVTLAGVREKVAMEITGHKTRSVFDRYHIVDTQDVSNAMQQWEAVASQHLLRKRAGQN